MSVKFELSNCRIGVALQVGYNHSDSTFGWKGYKNALTIYYMHSNENFIKEEHSYSLVPGLTPVVSVKNVRTVLLGQPYTQCVEDINYTTQGCLYGKLLDRVVRMCQCYPSYAEDGKNLKKKFSEVEECNFYLHATCVSFVKEQFDQTEVTCKPACYQDSIHQESI
ncbi:unnamed protein product [Oikopleura dioica]|uniref:Uncharacterized protein n=1 Tax=Oikopleura dioica TaxID=34765 RepID=E4XWF8_OIKDI|nr:unnamed protein product [Oikopleura dioica]